jgi:hypothetical protein
VPLEGVDVNFVPVLHASLGDAQKVSLHPTEGKVLEETERKPKLPGG